MNTLIRCKTDFDYNNYTYSDNNYSNIMIITNINNTYDNNWMKNRGLKCLYF